MSTLYELTGQATILYALLANEEIDEQIFTDTLEGMGVNEKLENCCYILAQLKGEVEMFKSEIERLQKRKKTIENNTTRLKNEMLNLLNATGEKSIKAGTFTVGTRKSKAVEIIAEDKIPQCFFVPTQPKLDKAEIKKRLTAGEEVPGAVLEERVSVAIR